MDRGLSMKLAFFLELSCKNVIETYDTQEEV